jgi:threonine dehydrogenase-like Zn-dependent dehydrogenase
MQAIVVESPGQVRYVDLPAPTPGPYEALCELLTCSLCAGTDSHIVDGVFPNLRYPVVLGHESIGRVVAVGARVRSFRLGDLVLRPSAVRPGETLGGYGSAFGGFAELGLVADAAALLADDPAARLPSFALAQQVAPHDFDPLIAGLFITFKEVYSVLQALGAGAGVSVLILGSGSVGLNFVRAARALGAGPIIATGRRDEPLQAALAAGADHAINVASEDLLSRARELTGGRGADLGIDAIGSYAAVNTALPAMSRDGHFGIYGVASRDESPLIDFARLPGGCRLSRCQPREERVHDEVLGLLARGELDLKGQVSHVLGWGEIEEGLRLVRERVASKVVMEVVGRVQE